MKYLNLLVLFLLSFLVGCTHINVTTFDVKKQKSCEASYTSLGKSVRNPQAKACGSVFGAAGTSYDELANLIPIEEILKAYLSKTQLPDIPTIPQVPGEDEEEIEQPPEVAPEPQPDPQTDKVTLDYYRKTNGDRPTFYTRQSQPMLSVGNTVRVVVGDYDETYTVKKRANGSVGADGAGGFVIKNSEVPGRGIAVLMPADYNGPMEPAYVTIKK